LDCSRAQFCWDLSSVFIHSLGDLMQSFGPSGILVPRSFSIDISSPDLPLEIQRQLLLPTSSWFGCLTYKPNMSKTELWVPLSSSLIMVLPKYFLHKRPSWDHAMWLKYQALPFFISLLCVVFFTISDLYLSLDYMYIFLLFVSLISM
jgi:hypothetical protein